MKNSSIKKVFLVFLASIFAPAISYAHTGFGAFSGFGDGFVHPLGGFDHVLAMVAVGIWAFQSGGRGVWAMPASFVAVMFVGGLLGFAGVKLPFVEQGIFVSILVFGALIAAARFPLVVGMVVTGAFALFHGHSHGTEIPAAASGLYYGLGFVLATTALHIAGIAMASALSLGRPNSVLVRFAGAAISLAGIIVYF
ncbi:MAG: HupE/UreJ family protein [Nitrospinae bacterium]|nr:HupE/UreJ family protein [Nitrospinota bacterium]